MVRAPSRIEVEPRTRMARGHLFAVPVLLTSLVAACGSVGLVDPALGKNACALLTTDEIRQASGRQPAPGTHGDLPSSCLWSFGSYDPTAGFVGVNLSYRERGDIDTYVAEESMPSGEQSAQAVSGLGDQALIVSLRLSRELWVRKGNTVLVMIVSVSATAPYNVTSERKVVELALQRA